ncbi:hypothetical protein ACU4GD_36560, partial [Cupriavidus basilensis]
MVLLVVLCGPLRMVPPPASASPDSLDPACRACARASSCRWRCCRLGQRGRRARMVPENTRATVTGFHDAVHQRVHAIAIGLAPWQRLGRGRAGCPGRVRSPLPPEVHCWPQSVHGHPVRSSSSACAARAASPKATIAGATVQPTTQSYKIFMNQASKNLEGEAGVPHWSPAPAGSLVQGHPRAAFGNAGATVAICDIDPVILAQAREAVEASGARCLALQCGVVVQQAGRLDVPAPSMKPSARCTSSSTTGAGAGAAGGRGPPRLKHYAYLTAPVPAPVVAVHQP